MGRSPKRKSTKQDPVQVG